MKKLIFVLPSYSTLASSHYPYLVKQLKWLNKKIELKVIIEKTINEPPAWLKSISLSPSSIFQRIKYLRQLKKQGFRRIYIHYSHFTLLLAKFLGFTTYFWHCEKFREFPLSKKIINHLLVDYPLILAFKLTDYLITGDEIIKKSYCGRFKIPLSKIKVVPHWINRQDFAPLPKKEKSVLRKKLCLPTDKKFILFVHHLSPRKGSRLLPEIIKKSLEKCKDFYFVVIGSGPDFEYLKNKLKKYSKNLKLLGAIPQPELPKYYQAADLFIMPSLQEGFPRVILEAMASNLPIVSFNAGNIESLLPSTMIVGSIKQMIGKIFELTGKTKYANLNQYSFENWQKAFQKQIL
jgi:glycosyltransferase involved in cell wall biosynthesis